MPDGSITFKTALDNSVLEKDLAAAKRKIQSLNDTIATKKAERLPILNQLGELGTAVDAAKAKLAEMQSGETFASQSAIAEQAEEVKRLENELDAAERKATQYESAINRANIQLDLAKEKAGALDAELANAPANVDAMAEATERADGFMEKFMLRVKGLAKRVFIFSLITAAFRALRNLMSGYIKSNSEAAAAIAQLKGALLTLAQPILDVLIPAFTVLVQVLARVVTAIARLVSMLFGKSLKASATNAKSLYNQANALEAVGGAAKEAQQNLSGLDEINTFQADSGGDGGSSAGGSGGSITPDFSLGDMDEGKLKNILAVVEMIGIAFATWKISSALGLNLTQAIGLAIALYGALQFVHGVADALTDGLDWENLQQMLFGLTLAAVGLYVAFGPVAAGIAAVVGGLAMLVIGFRDAAKNGWKMENLLAVVAGLFATGLGIALITGSLLPALIAGIAALLVAITVATGHGGEMIEGLKKIVEGFKDFFVGIFSGDIAKAIGGLNKIFDGFKETVGAIWDGIKDLFLKGLDFIDEKTGGKLRHMIATLKWGVTFVFDLIKSVFGGAVDVIRDLFGDITEFITNVFTGDFDAALKNLSDLWDDTIRGLKNIIIDVVNACIRALNRISWDVPSWVPVIGGRHIGPNIKEIPKLAQGAVIPPNREFMAVLGDQKSGTNIEAPLDTIKQAVAEVMATMGNQGGQKLYAMANGRVMFQFILDEAKAQQMRTGRNPFDLTT